MKLLCSLALSLFFAAAVSAADALPVFKGVMTLDAESRFVLVAPDGTSSQWIKLGDSFAGYGLKSYDPKESALELTRPGGANITLHLDNGRGILEGGAPASTSKSLTAANDLMRVMRFDEMMKKMMDQQKKSMGPMLQQMLGQAAGGMSQSERDAFVAFQQKLMGDMMDSVLGPDLQAEMAKAYSETFSEAELNAQAAFYSTPAGQALIDKTPEVQAKLQGMITPRILGNMGKIQASTKEFMQDMAQKRAAANAAAGK